MKLMFEGKVELGDVCRVSGYDDYKNGAIHIGGQDVVNTIERTFKSGAKLIIGILDETFNGDLFVETGWGYSEHTPMDSDELKVGDHDLIEILRRYEDQSIKVWVSDEPINILE